MPDAQNFEGLRILETSLTLHSSYLYVVHGIQIGFIVIVGINITFTPKSLIICLFNEQV